MSFTDYLAQVEADWRRRTWFARPRHADPVLWLSAVREVAELAGDPLPGLADIDPPNPFPFGAMPRWS